MPKDTEETIKVLAGFTAKQWAVIIVLVVSFLGAGAWVEDRYAKIKYVEDSVQTTNNAFQQSKQQIEQSHFLTLEIFSTLPETQQNAIMKKMSLSHVTKSKSK